jgi:uncharacterized protein YbjT (DUF2867 family)
MRFLIYLGYLVAALVLLVVAYVFVLSGSFHTPTNVLTPAAYQSPGGPILVFGGTRATGLEIVRELRRRGEVVVVAARSSSDTTELDKLGVRVVQANALNAAEVNDAVASDSFAAVFSTLGTTRGDQANRPDFDGNRNVFEAAKRNGVRRVVFITVIGAGDSFDAAPLPARRALAEVIELKTRAEDHLKASGLDYTIIRPGGLSDRGATGQAFLAADPQAFSYISRTDLAALSVAALGDPATIGRTYAAYDPLPQDPVEDVQRLRAPP